MTSAVKDGTAGVPAGAKPKLGDRLSIQRSSVFDLLKQLAEDNAKFFSKTAPSSSYSKRLFESCTEILVSTNALRDLVGTLQRLAPRYDYDRLTPGNGYRSLICICDIVLFHLISILRACSEKRYTLIFRSSYYCKEVEAYGAVLRFLVLSFQQVVSRTFEVPGNSLFPPLDEDYGKHEKILKGIEALDASCFYGRPLGFQFAPSVGRIFRFIGVVLATYSLSWERGYGPIGSLLNTGRFILSPEQRASRILKVTQEADIEFCKGFWNLSELGNQMPRFFCPNMAVNDEAEIPVDKPVRLETEKGENIRIPEPSSHTGVRPVRIRILSYMHRQNLSASAGMEGLTPSPYLLLHCHGGGYVATSSKSHETYLRTWAKSLNCTIVSVDYSLAPENPYPRPTEEVLYTYAYILNHPAEFGWTGEKICLVGDSAGGNLITSVSLRLIQLGVKKRPDGLILIYTPFLFQYLPSPSRLLSFLDPLLHMGVVLRCTAAYTSGYISDEKPRRTASPERHRHKSLQEYVEEVQKVQSNKIFNLEDSSIVSLVNLNGWKVDEKQSQGPPSKTARKHEEDAEQENKAGSSEEDEEVVAHKASLSGVEVMSDPDRILVRLSTSMYDQQLVEYLKDHPLTKDSLVPLDENDEEELGSSGPVSRKTSIESNLTPSLTISAIDSEQDVDPALMVAEPTETSVPPAPRRTLVASLSSHSLASMASLSSQSLATASRQMLNVRSFGQSLASTAATAAGQAMDNLSGWFDTTDTAGKADKAKLNRVASLTPQMAAKLQQEEAEETVKDSYIDKLTKNKVPRDPLISPMYASAEVLRQLPPMWFLACHLDPLLDDTISFARKARDSGSKVMSLDLVDNLPHGFLNFTLMSLECREGAKLCLKRIKEAFGLGEALFTL